jgi:transposase
MECSCGGSCATRASPARPASCASGRPGAAAISREDPPRLAARTGADEPAGDTAVLAEAATLAEAEHTLVATLVDAGPEIAEAVAVARAFGAMIRQHAADALDPWIKAARRSELRGFADSIDRDHAAVAAALRLPWSTGPVEGRINKLRLVKRQMYGRANFDLLRQRVLTAA